MKCPVCGHDYAEQDRLEKHIDEDHRGQVFDFYG